MLENILTSEPAPETADFEIVLGRRQLAMWLFLATVAAALVAGLAYMAGRAATPPRHTTAATQPAPAAAAIPVVEGTIMRAAEPPIFQDPPPGAVYHQMCAVDKGMAVVFVEGLRKMGFPAIVAPGPNEKIFRVLVGPTPDAATLKRLKDGLAKAGLATFIRRYQAPATVRGASSSPAPPA